MFIILGVVYGVFAITAVFFFVYTKGGGNVGADASNRQIAQTQPANPQNPSADIIADISEETVPVTDETEPVTTSVTETPVLIATILDRQPDIDIHGTANVSDFVIKTIYSDGTISTATPSMIELPEDFVQGSTITVHDGDVSLSVDVNVNGIVTSASHKYADEIANADKVHLSDTLLVTEKQYETPSGMPYWLVHIVCENPATQIQRSAIEIPKTRTLEAAHEDEGWVFGITGSYTNGYGIYSYGMILQDKELISSYGQCFSDATMVLEDDGRLTSYHYATLSQALDMGARDSFSSYMPTLIADYNLPALDKIWSPVTAIGMTENGEYYAMFISNKGARSYVSYSEMRDVFLDRGCVYAKCLNGWGYTGMYMEDDYIVTSEASGFDYRPTGDFFVVYD